MENGIDYMAAIVALADATRHAAKAESGVVRDNARTMAFSVSDHARIVSEIQAALTALGVTTLSVRDNAHTVARGALIAAINPRFAGGE